MKHETVPYDYPVETRKGKLIPYCTLNPNYTNCINLLDCV